MSQFDANNDVSRKLNLARGFAPVTTEPLHPGALLSRRALAGGAIALIAPQPDPMLEFGATRLVSDSVVLGCPHQRCPNWPRGSFEIGREDLLGAGHAQA